MRVLVVTVVHVPQDARILHRQILALLDAGHEVTYAAPWTATGQEPPSTLSVVDLPRAAGRRRVAAVRAARRLLRRRARDHDLVLLHDPDLLLAVAFVRGLPPVVWDVHEDTAAALVDKPWVPALLRPPLRLLVRAAERWAERRLRLLLAEHAYADRFRREHPVVPNYPWVPEEVPPPGSDRVVYLGRVSRLRGAGELLAIADGLPEGVALEIVGSADPDVRPAIEAAHRAGRLRWHGFVPNDAAVALLDGALAGLSLLHDEPNYRASLPTKVLEYMARGVPVITTPLPEARRLVEEHRCGAVVPFGDPAAAAAAVAAVRELVADPELREAQGHNGHAAARARYSWQAEGERFAALLAHWATRS